ncbi:hypothetical protein [Sebaldella sp. S0638]|uniref:hypothetical protein n=1 Tax=Sebaldella sp. S0638 TaxID=2957809 RepID=UPI0020A084D5|nr:hypothetical protein [Sebaldella sp. S0638]MCP1226067.1 hypothetical protein [Sebaldella sp. S0638]
MKKLLVLLTLIGGLTYSSTIYIDIAGPKYLTVNADQGFDFMGLPLHMFTKKGRDTEARMYKLSGYKISGKVDAAEKLYSYFLEKVSKEETFEEELNKLSELTTAEKENILNSMSKSFTSKWNDEGVKIVVSNSTNKKQFNNKTRKNAIFYDDVEHKLYFNEDLFDFTDKEKITGSIGYANYDHFLFYNSEKWNEWDFTDINDFFGVNK